MLNILTKLVFFVFIIPLSLEGKEILKIDYSGPVADWESYGSASGGGHFSFADQVTKENVRMLEKACTLNPDVLIPDLEDSIPLSQKSQARDVLSSNLNKLIESSEKLLRYMKINLKLDLSHLPEGHTGHLMPTEEVVNTFLDISKKSKIKNILEFGFNTGWSSYIMLELFKKAKITRIEIYKFSPISYFPSHISSHFFY